MSKKLKDRREKKIRNRFNKPFPQHFAIAKEVLQINRSLIKEGTVGASRKISKFFLVDSGLESPFAEKRLLELVGDIVLNLFNELGPVYGKAAQIALSRIDGDAQEIVDKMNLNRIFSDWPAMPFEEVQKILDEEVPDWHQEFVIEPHPVGVASMAQVHTAIDESGRQWVIKVVKPLSDKRLHETLDAIEQIIRLSKPLEVTAVGRRTLKELRSLVAALRYETNLELEKKNLHRMREKLQGRKQQVLRLPETYDEFCTQRVMTLEKFNGISLSDVVSGHLVLSSHQRKKLAKKVLQELLVQVFEIGLFHGDPHAGNLILLEDGTVGLFDWGLAGELDDTDRRHISSLLRSLMTWNKERLIDSLADIAEDYKCEVSRDEISQEIESVASKIREQKEEEGKVSLHELLEVILKAADKLEIPVPDGLLMMAKSLITVEGLAKGIDPQIAMGRIATPLLFKAAKPQMKDLVELSRKLPRFAGQFLNRA